MSVHVIGLGRQRPAAEFAELFDGAAVIARNSALARRWLGGAREIDAGLDDLFDRLPPGEIRDAAVQRIEDVVMQSGRCVYLVPESGLLGDATVETVMSKLPCETLPGAFQSVPASASSQIVDALELAVAEERAPFDAGHGAIDQTRPLIVTNYTGQSVWSLAGRRLNRVYGSREFQPTASGTLFIDGLDGPAESSSFGGFEQVVAYLRSPEGCPWDREQTFASLYPMMLEECEELREALEAGSGDEAADELGDVLLHIVMIAQIAREAGTFGFEDVLRAISAKMIRRHPHVFGDEEISSIDDLYAIWRDVKESERAEKLKARAAGGEG